jgi:hypothetical protein
MTITISNYGSFEIPNEKIQELIEWLQKNSIKLEQNKTDFKGQELIID